jgi:diaminopimelate epimerase
MRFYYVKLHGAGNSYVFAEACDLPPEGRWPAVARAVSDAATGLGGDGLVVVGSDPEGTWSMRIFNRDGSEAEFCGNGVRALGKYLFDRGRVGRHFSVTTRAGPVRLAVLQTRGRRAQTLSVAVRRPRVLDTASPFPVTVAGEELRLWRVNAGNPHAVLFGSGRLPAHTWLRRVGREVSVHPVFLGGVNFHAAAVRSAEDVRVWHFERGSGETRACGSGALAVWAAGQTAGVLAPRVCVRTPGGVLQVEALPDDEVLLSGPAREISHGWFVGPGV